MARRLIINADDYGLCREVNDAIEQLIEGGRLRDTSVLATGRYFAESVSFLKRHPEVSVGVHLNAVEGTPVAETAEVKAILDKDGAFVDRNSLILRWLTSPLRVGAALDAEWSAQIELLRSNGIEISHLDSHQHIHSFPPFRRITQRLSARYGIASIRTPSEANPHRRRVLPSYMLRAMNGVSLLLFRHKNVVSSDHFLGFKLAGAYNEDLLMNEFRLLRDGVTELVVHPSIAAAVPYPEMDGEAEFRALLSEQLWKNISDRSIEIVTWAQVSKETSATPSAAAVLV